MYKSPYSIDCRMLAIDEVLKKKTSRKAFKTALMVVYGKKKDRGHLKEQVKKLEKDKRTVYSSVYGVMKQKMPYLMSFLEYYGAGIY